MDVPSTTPIPEHYLIAKVKVAGFDVSNIQIDRFVQCIASKMSSVPYLVAVRIQGMAMSVISSLKAITQSNYDESQAMNAFFIAMANQQQQQSSGGSLDEKAIEAMAEEAIIDCLKANSTKLINLSDLVDMLEFWTITNINGDLQLWFKFKDGIRLNLDRKLYKLKMYLERYHLSLNVDKKFELKDLFGLMDTIAGDKYKQFSFPEDPFFAALLRKYIIDVIESKNYDVFCSCNSIPPTLYIRKRYFMKEIAPVVAAAIGGNMKDVTLKDVPSIFQKWGIFKSAEARPVVVPECINGVVHQGVIEDRYYEINIDTLAMITQVDDICPQSQSQVQTQGSGEETKPQSNEANAQSSDNDEDNEVMQ
jgi:hypothetical protein